MRSGQRGRVCHRWFTRGQRPPGLCDQRYTWAHLSSTLAPDEHAAMVVDGAGWHIARDLRIPGNVTLVLMPPCAPESNPVERVWLFLRERHLSHRLLARYNAIVDALCTASNALTPERPLPLTSCPYLNQVSF